MSDEVDKPIPSGRHRAPLTSEELQELLEDLDQQQRREATRQRRIEQETDGGVHWCP